MDWELTWLTVEAVATFVLTLGVGIAIWQIIVAKRSTNAQIAVQLFSKIREPKIKQLLGKVVYQTDPEKMTELKEEDKIILGELLDWFDMAGALIY